MAIKTTLISGNDSGTAVYAVCYSGDLSLTFLFSQDPHCPWSVNSRVANFFHRIEVKDENETYHDAVSMREAISSSVSHVWPSCASHPSVRLPDVVVYIQQDRQNRLIWRIAHESAFREYFETLLSAETVQNWATLRSGTGLGWVSYDSLQYSDVLGSRGGITVVRSSQTLDNDQYVYKGLSFRQFLESASGFQHERETFYHELNMIFQLPPHPNLVRPPTMLVTMGEIHHEPTSDRRVCGALYPYLKRQSLQEVIEKARGDGTRVPLRLKAKWAYQISSAMALVHLVCEFHMDLKPSNILLGGRNNVVLIDWKQLGATPFFLAPEATGEYDVELAAVVKSTGTTMDYQLRYTRYAGPVEPPSRAWPRRNVFPMWQGLCPRATEAAEMYSLGRTFWVILEQIGRDFFESDDGGVRVEFDAWRMRDDDIPGHWKDFLVRCTDEDPNQRGKFDDAVKFWLSELEAIVYGS